MVSAPGKKQKFPLSWGVGGQRTSHGVVAAAHTAHMIVTLMSEHITYRHIHQPRPILLHQRHQPRPPPLHHRICRLPTLRQRQFAEPFRHSRMHHQHNIRTLSRSRQRNRHQRAVRNIRMGTFRPNPGAMHVRVMRARPRSHFQHRGHFGRNEGV